MIDRRFAAREIQRMSGLDYFGSLKTEAVEELVTALCRADSEIIAMAAINEWLETSATRPTPRDIRLILGRFNGHHANCSRCCDTGLVLIDWTIQRCSCSAGDLKGATDWVGTKIHPDDRIEL